MVKFAGDVLVSHSGSFDREEWHCGGNESVDAAGIVVHAIVDIVGVFGLVAIRECVALHGEQGGNGRYRNGHAIAPTVRHVRFAQQQLGHGTTDDGKLAFEAAEYLADFD